MSKADQESSKARELRRLLRRLRAWQAFNKTGQDRDCGRAADAIERLMRLSDIVAPPARRKENEPKRNDTAKIARAG